MLANTITALQQDLTCALGPHLKPGCLWAAHGCCITDTGLTLETFQALLQHTTGATADKIKKWREEVDDLINNQGRGQVLPEAGEGAEEEKSGRS